MFESSIPQNNNDLNAEKGPACDVRNRVAVSAMYDVPAWGRSSVTRAVTRNWQTAAIFQAQSGFPLTISVFGDTANTGTALGLEVTETKDRYAMGFRFFGEASDTGSDGSNLSILHEVTKSLQNNEEWCAEFSFRIKVDGPQGLGGEEAQSK
jgi:hypothetical protein